MEKPLRIKLHVLSPIHIGCDDVYEPTSFIIDETRKVLIEFDPIDFIANLTLAQKTEFSRMCIGDDLLAIFKFVKRAYKDGNPLREIDVSRGLVEHYKNVLAMSSFNKNAVINQFTMNKTSYNPQTNEVYIPGTSVKGSLRTAYLEYVAAQKGIKDRKDKAKDLERELLGGKFETDPFRMVKISDFQPFENVKTRIVYGVNKKKRISDRETNASTGPQQIFETIQGGSVFEGAININVPEKTAGIKAAIELKTLFKSANKHYKKLFNQEVSVLNTHGFGKVDSGKFLEGLGDTCCLIRLGRHSGAEAVTIEGNRNIKIMQGQGRQPKDMPSSTTLWLASESARPTSGNGLIPFGWAVLEVVPFDATKGLFGRPTKAKLTSEAPTKQADKLIEVPVEKPVAKKEPERVTWPGATLTYSPGNKTLTASYQNKKAELQIGDDRSIVPEQYHAKLFDKRKGAQMDVVVEPLGNAFRIVKCGKE